MKIRLIGMPSVAAIAIGLGLGLGACAQNVQGELQSEASEKPLGPLERVAPPTVKPGAAVTFSHTQSDKGRHGDIEVTMRESYQDGAVTVTAAGGDGLEVFGAGVTQRLDAEDRASHTWTIGYQAEADGIYYVNLFASYETADGKPGLSRAYSARVQVGDVVQAKPTSDVSKLETTPEGETIIMMEADEVIE